MTDWNLIIFFLDCTIILYLVGGPYVTELKKSPEKRACEILRCYNSNSILKMPSITLGSYASEHHTLLKMKLFVVILRLI
jgi:hypothetical protein